MTKMEEIADTEQEIPVDIVYSKTQELVKVSIIIVNYNGREYIDSCLRPLIEIVPSGAEVIVVDNASPDGSGSYIAEQFPNITTVCSQTNLGFGSGNNLGVEYAQGEYLIFLNPDCYVTEGWAEAMLAVLETSPEVGMVTPKLLLANEPDLINACGNEMHFTGLTLCRGARASAELYDTAVAVSAVSGAAFVIRKELFEELGGFDPLMFMYMEDTDLSARARQVGYTCVYTPDSIIYHDYALRFGPNKTYYQERNRYIMMLKLWRWRTLALMLIPVLLAEVITWGFVLVKDRRSANNKIRAYKEIVEIWPRIMTQRRTIQMRRKVNDRELLAGLTYRIDFDQTGKDVSSAFARWVFNPVFYAFYRGLSLLVRW